MTQLSLVTSGRRGTLLIGGYDVSDCAEGVTLSFDPLDGLQARVDLVLHTSRVEGDAHVTVPDVTRDALITLGWTPPVDEPLAPVPPEES